MVSLLPTDTEIQGFQSLDDVREWAGLPAAIWTAFNTGCDTLSNIRMVAALPRTALLAHMRAVRIAVTGDPNGRPLNAAESIQVGLLWRACRRTCGLEDQDPLADPVVQPIAAGPAASAPAAKKVKASTVIDQLDDTEINPLSRSDIDQCYLNHIEIKGAEPNQDSKPSPEQIAALKDRVEARGEAPYADFSLFTPYGRRMQKQMRTKSWVFQPDGTFRTVDIPGPNCFSAWAGCWKVYRATLYMLRHQQPAPSTRKQVVTPAVMEEYYENIAKLVEEFPEAWHLIMQAEDRCRGEALDRYRRNLTKAQVEGNLPMGINFDASAPWNGAFMFAARDFEFWQKNVIRPAHTFLARGGKNMTAKSAGEATMSQEAKAALEKPAHHGQPESPSKRKRKREPGAASAGPTGKEAEGNHPRKWGTHYISDYDGVELCFRYSKGKLGDCSDPCPEGRSHRCQHCLGSHINSACPAVAKKQKGSGKRKPSGPAK